MRAPRFSRLRAGRRGLVVAVAAIAAAMSFAVVAIGASLPGSVFEIDTNANLVVDSPLTNDDWASIPQGTTPGTEIRKADTASGSTDESFGNGTKEDTAVPSVIDGSIPPNKSDLKFFGVYQEGTGANGFLNMFWSRVQEPKGTTNMDFEFNKNQCSNAGSGCSANGVTPIRSAGDLLIQYDLSQGGTNPKLFLSEWVTSGAGSQCEASNAIPCWSTKEDLTASGDAIGSINTSAITLANSDGLGAHSARTFGEAQIDLSAIFDSTDCESFGSAYLKSRSSDSFTSALKDFVPPADVNVSNCASVSVTKTGDDAGSQEGAVFTLYEGTDTTGTVVGTCTVDAAGDCLPIFDNLLPGDYTIDETTVPAGYDADPNLPDTFTLATGDALELPYVDQAAPGQVDVSKVDDDGNPVEGAVFTLYAPAGVDANNVPTGSAAGSCQTGALGTCTISNVTPGTYTIDESTVPAGYAKDSAFPQEITIDNGETEVVSATDPSEFRMIVLVCRESDDTLYSSAVSINGDSRPDSLTTAQAGTAGLSESALCALTAGAKGGLVRADNDQSAEVTIP